jgi:aspartyl-tRNA(Asn)/glutamyl-tRNA(Gln) amidotransferase subunit C
MSTLEKKDLVHLAKLASLPLDEAELARFEVDLQRIVAHVETLLAVDVTNVPPMTSAAGAAPPMREDAPRPGLTHADALAAAPEEEGGGFAVPTFVSS